MDSWSTIFLMTHGHIRRLATLQVGELDIMSKPWNAQKKNIYIYIDMYI